MAKLTKTLYSIKDKNTDSFYLKDNGDGGLWLFETLAEAEDIANYFYIGFEIVEVKVTYFEKKPYPTSIYTMGRK